MRCASFVYFLNVFYLTNLIIKVMSQIGQLSNIISYPTSLLFSYMISSKEKDGVYWPGVVYFLAAFYHCIGISLHFKALGFKDGILLRRLKTRLPAEHDVKGFGDQAIRVVAFDAVNDSTTKGPV